MAPISSQHAVQPRRPMLLPPPLLDKASAAKPSHSVRAPEAAANARVAPCQQVLSRPGLRPAAAATYTAATHHSCHRQQQTSLGYPSPPFSAAARGWLLTELSHPMFRPAATQQNQHTNAAPCGIPCHCMSPVCRAVCTRFPPSPHGRVSHHAAETHCDR